MKTTLTQFDKIGARLLAADMIHAAAKIAKRYGVRLVDRDVQFTTERALIKIEAALIKKGVKLLDAKAKTRSIRPKPACYSLAFTVFGSGAFPTDMLRRDQCYPATNEDVNNIIWMPSEHGGDAPERHVCLIKTVKSRSQVKTAINDARWASLGWRVAREPGALNAPMLVPR